MGCGGCSGRRRSPGWWSGSGAGWSAVSPWTAPSPWSAPRTPSAERPPGSPAGPEPAGVVLADLAAAAAGDPAALSQGQLPTLVLRALALREEVPAPADSAAAQRLWTTAGVVADDLVSQVLVLNFRAGGE